MVKNAWQDGSVGEQSASPSVADPAAGGLVHLRGRIRPVS